MAQNHQKNAEQRPNNSLKNISGPKVHHDYEKNPIEIQAAENERQLGTVRREIKVQKYQFNILNMT